MRIPFASQSYQSESLPLSAQRVVNLYAEIQPGGAKSILSLFGTPGIPLYQEVGNGPLRGMIEMAGDLYVVTGQSAFRVQSNGTATLLGSIPGTGPVDMDHNGTQVGVLIGPGADDFFVLTSTTLTQVTDSDYPGATSWAFLDGFGVFTRTNSGQFFISGSYDLTSFNASQFATAEGSPDLLVGLHVDHRELWLFGTQTTEVWYNAGTSPFPFERASGAYIEKGCAAKTSLAKLDNTVFWVGNDRVVYRADGYTPKRVSTHAIELMLEKHLGLGDLTSFAYTHKGHAFYVLKKPGEFTFVFDVASGLWHERVSNGRKDWRISSYVSAFNRHLVGDDSTGKIGYLDLDTYGTEFGDTVVALAASPPLWAEAETAEMQNLIVDCESGVGLTSGQGSDPQLMLRWSDDGGHTWSNEVWRSAGAIGSYKHRARWDRLGQFQQRVLELSISDPVKRAINGAYATLKGGRL